MRHLVRGIAAFLWLVALAAVAAHLLRIRMPPEMEARLGGSELHDTHFARFDLHPWSTYLHVVFGGLLAALIPFQLSGTLRRRYVSLHRVSGAVFVGSGLVAVSSGAYLGTVMPFGGVPETLTLMPMALFFVWCLIQGLRSALAGQVQSHRRWMARSVAIVLSVATQRALFSVLLQLHWWSAPTVFWVALAIAPLLNLAVAEWLIRGSFADALPLKTHSTETVTRTSAQSVPAGVPGVSHEQARRVKPAP